MRGLRAFIVCSCPIFLRSRGVSNCSISLGPSAVDCRVPSLVPSKYPRGNPRQARCRRPAFTESSFKLSLNQDQYRQRFQSVVARRYASAALSARILLRWFQALDKGCCGPIRGHTPDQDYINALSTFADSGELSPGREYSTVIDVFCCRAATPS
jgi:hypothetical protein